MCAVLWLQLLACDPWDSASPERQAESRTDVNDALLGPAERVPIERLQAEEAAREALFEEERLRLAEAAEARAVAGRERTLAVGRAWDLRLLDTLALQLDLFAQLAEAVASYGDTDALRGWALEAAQAAHVRRVELAALRERWYGAANPPRVVGDADAEALAPVTARLAREWGAEAPPGGDAPPPGDAPPYGPRPDEAPVERLPEPPPLLPAAFARIDARALAGPGGVIHAPVAVRSLARVSEALVTLATTGAMQASREELRALAVRVQLEQRAVLAELAALADRRG